MNTINDYNENFFRFISDNLDKDVNTLRLKYSSIEDCGFDIRFAITQIECRQKASKKISEILCNKSFVFPSKILSEQCTDERIAQFHKTLFTDCRNVLDMTAGLCVDSYYISNSSCKVTALEIQPDVASIGNYNMNELRANVEVKNCDSSEYIKNNDVFYDAIFIDPARRGVENNRLYAIEACTPNVIEIIPEIKNKCNYIIVKASPMIDITETLRKIDSISDIWIVGVKNECKEVLIKVDFINDDIVTIIHTINMISDNDCQELTYIYDKNNPSHQQQMFPTCGNYLYEPNCCIMKAGAYNELFKRYSTISKLNINTHLFLSEDIYTDFPGRKFIIQEIIPFKDKQLKSVSRKYPKINVGVRNFIMTAEQLKARLKVKDGGAFYLFGVKIIDDSYQLIICSKATF